MVGGFGGEIAQFASRFEVDWDSGTRWHDFSAEHIIEALNALKYNTFSEYLVHRDISCDLALFVPN
jgi:hypothetical protein